jgi:hypothetical protein
MGFLIALLPLLWAGTATHAQDNSEYLIKAGFIYNFANLVQWPASSFSQADSPIVIGIVGEDHFGTTLDRVLQGKKVNGRPFAIKRFHATSQLQKASDVKECQILYVSSSEMAHLGEVLQLVKGSPVLTIGEMPGFAKSGGMINLVVEDNRVRFEVNVDAAKEADLSISSRLLALARIIQSPGSDGRKAE